VKAQLAEPAEIDRVAEDAHGFLRRVEAHRVLRHHEINHELAATVIVAGGGELRVGGPVCLGSLDVVDEIDERIERRVSQSEESVLNIFDARFQLFFREMMAGLAGTISITDRRDFLQWIPGRQKQDRPEER
jgi:hypothetical protein